MSAKSSEKTAVIHYDDIQATGRRWKQQRAERDAQEVGWAAPLEGDTEGRVCEIVHDVSHHVAPSDFSKLARM